MTPPAPEQPDTPSTPDLSVIINIHGERVALGPHRRDLLPLYERWVNDFMVTRTLSLGMRPFTTEQETDWYDSRRTATSDIGFTIYERATLRPIGNTGLHNINTEHGTAEFGIMIGEKDAWGHGYGTETARLMLDYGFNVLGLHNIWLRALSTNERGLRAYRRAGFKEIGRRREAHRIGPRRYDDVLMDCLAHEFTDSVLIALLP